MPHSTGCGICILFPAEEPPHELRSASARLLQLKVVPSLETLNFKRVLRKLTGASHFLSRMPHDLPKAYDPTAIEDHWAEYWVREKLFAQPTPAANSTGDAGQSAFTILLPPPNVTGNLHMGHMFEHTESDILTRWRRMSGGKVLWIPGTDHAGIATQMLVERQVVSEGTTRQKLGREAFIERVWEWKRHYGGAILDQMKRLGASVDWDREYFTMDERLSVAVREAFVRLYDQGLIYRGAYIVNWCPRCQTAISDLEVVYDEHKGPPVGDPLSRRRRRRQRHRRVPYRCHHAARNHAWRRGRGHPP